MNKRYISMNIEADENFYLNRAVVTYEENGRVRSVYSLGNSIKYDLKDFAAQENIPIDRLIHVKPKVNFEITSFSIDLPPYSRLSAGKIPGCTSLLIKLMKEKVEQRNQQRQIKLSKIKGVIKFTARGVALFGVLALLSQPVIYKLQEINALNNQYVTISLYSIRQEMSPDMVSMLNNYSDFDFIMTNMAQKNWSELKDANLSSFFDNLDWINSTNTAYIRGILNNDHTSKTMYVTYFEKYFEDTPNDYYAIKYINNCFNTIERSTRNVKDAVNKYLDFVIDKNNQQNNHTVRGNDGNPMFIYYDWMSPAAKYLINSQMLEIIRAYDFNGKTYVYNSYTKEQIINRIEEYQRENRNAIFRNIGIDERKR